MKKYKIRFDCSSFQDIVVEAKSKDEAIDLAYPKTNCPQNGMDFTEFLPVEDDDEIDL